jgi:hypothetical protein
MSHYTSTERSTAMKALQRLVTILGELASEPRPPLRGNGLRLAPPSLRLGEGAWR